MPHQEGHHGLDHSRDPCPWVALSDFGGAFCMGVCQPITIHTPSNRAILTIFATGNRRSSLARHQRLPQLTLQRTHDRLHHCHQSARSGARRQLRRLGRHVQHFRLRGKGRPKKRRPLERHHRWLLYRRRISSQRRAEGDKKWCDRMRDPAGCDRGCGHWVSANDGGEYEAGTASGPAAGKWQ